MARRVHHPLLGEVDPVDGPVMLKDEGVAAPPESPDPPKSGPFDDSIDGFGFSFPVPELFPPTPRERIEQRLRGLPGRARSVAARGLRMLAARLEKP